MGKPSGSPGKGNGKGNGKGGDGDTTATTTTTTTTAIIDETGAIVGTEDDDVLMGTDDVDDVLIGLDGNDFMDGGGGSDTYLVSGYDGVDTIMDSGPEVDGGDVQSSSSDDPNWDVLLAGQKATYFYMSSFSSINGIEEICAGGFGGVDIRGTMGDNVLDFSTTLLTGISYIMGYEGDDTITGSWGNDRILGGPGNDTLDGGGGDDRLTGGPGADILEGGAGSDTFILGNAHDAGDTILDFTSDEDAININGIILDADYVGYSLVQDGADTIIRVELDDGSTNDVATLLGVDVGDLSGSDFLV